MLQIVEFNSVTLPTFCKLELQAHFFVSAWVLGSCKDRNKNLLFLIFGGIFFLRIKNLFRIGMALAWLWMADRPAAGRWAGRAVGFGSDVVFGLFDGCSIYSFFSILSLMSRMLKRMAHVAIPCNSRVKDAIF
jgi:hypothetical protein